MDLIQAMQERHSVRAYTDRPIERKTAEKLRDFVRRCAGESGLRLELVTDEPTAFDGPMAHYGKFFGVRNYIVLAGKKAPDLDERCGCYGEKIVLYAQTLGLNTCWVALTYKKGAVRVQLAPGEKLCVVIAVGYGVNNGVPHKSKPIESVMQPEGTPPDWFSAGVEAALLAPTAMNQQKFVFSLKEDRVSVKPGLGFYSKVDLGIVKYHFELGAGDVPFQWA